MSIQIPIFKRGGIVCAHALIDEADIVAVQSYRWNLDRDGYARTRIATRTRSLHRLLLNLAIGDKRIVDHINGDRLDNRRVNLRIADCRVNSQNRLAVSQSGVRGVVWHKQCRKWQAGATLEGRFHYLGLFEDKTAAAATAAAFRAAHMPGSRDALIGDGR